MLVALMALSVPAGTAAPAPVPRIIGGAPVPGGALPFVAEITATAGHSRYICTGTVISPLVVLTAAHCTRDSQNTPFPLGDYSVSIGSANLSQSPGETRSVAAVSAYASPGSLIGDVATLTLSSPTSMPPVRIATPSDSALYAPGTSVVAAGFGRTDLNGPPSVVLEQGTVAVQANTTCRAADAAFDATTQVCASAPGFHPAVCNGDSGGPLLAATAAGWVQVGVTSFGQGDCATGPDYYARVSSVAGWIQSTISGTPPPPAFVPPLVAPPTPTAALVGDGATVSFSPAGADPATILSGYSVALHASDGRLVGTQTLDDHTTTATFPALRPGTYQASVTATYTGGASDATVSPPVALAEPANTRRPAVTGEPLPGKVLYCSTGEWAWPGAPTFDQLWVRDGVETDTTGGSYHVQPADSGHAMACEVTLHTAAGTDARALSPSVSVLVRLAEAVPPSVRGTARPGRTLTCSAGRWRHSGRLRTAFQWLRDGRLLAQPRSGRYVVRARDVEHRVACRVHVTARGGQATRTTRAVTVRR